MGGPSGSFGRRQPRPCISCDGPGLGERGRPGPLPFLTSRPHSLILESLPSTQPRLSWHLNPLDGGWVGEFLLFRKVTCLTRLSTHHYNPLSLPGMGLCFLTRLPPPSFVSTLLQPGQALDEAHLGRLFTLVVIEDWSLLLTSWKCVLPLKTTIQWPLRVQRGHGSLGGAYAEAKKGYLRLPESSLQLRHYFGWKKILRKLAHPFKW